MYTQLVALSFAATVSIVSGYPIIGDVVNCRSGPGTSFAVVKTYKQGVDVSLTCQGAGTSVNGDALWDKTTDGCYVADYYVKTGTGNYVVAHCDSGNPAPSPAPNPAPSTGNLPGLDATQSKHAQAIIAEAKKEDLGRQGCAAGIATALVESSIHIYANNAVPSSLNYPHDLVGSDHDSVGIFQQRAQFYPNIAADMDAAQSAAQFFSKMKNVSGWKTMDVGPLCQKVQGSAYPTRYAARVADADKICAAGGL